MDDLDSAIALASECMDAAEDQVDIVDSTGSIVFDPPELVDRIMEHRAQRSARLRRLQSSNRLRP